MKALDELEFDIAGGSLPSMEQLDELRMVVNASERNRLKFADRLRQNAGDGLREGLGFSVLGETAHAIDKLHPSAQDAVSLMALGRCHRELGQYEEAVDAFEKAGQAGAESLLVSLEKSRAFRLSGQIDQAESELSNCSNFENVSADYHCEKGKICDAKGQYEDAVSEYEKAVELDSHHAAALFQLAYAFDLRGDQETAIHYYRQVAQGSPSYVSALLNISVLYEDREEYEKALRCVETVLSAHPNHRKARMFLQDIESSMVMIYDEEKEKRRDRQNKILEIPISDFELSVRSRNCLRKMNIHTLGDLLQITEAELLSYKNFGETSLNEIKKMLESKGLQLGLGVPDRSAGGGELELPEGADDELLSKSVEELELSVRSRRCLSRLGVRTIGDLISKTEAELLGCKNFGVTSLNEIKERLTGFGLALRTLE